MEILQRDMDWFLFTKKVVYTGLAVFIAGGISVWANNPLWLITLPVLQALQNFVKHI